MKWSIIRDDIYTKELREIDKVFESIDSNLKNNTPHFLKYLPLKEWLKSRGSNAKLTIREYSDLTAIVHRLKKDLMAVEGNKEATDSYKENVKINYLRMMHKHSGDLKLEVAARLIKEANFPIEIYEEYYLELKDSTPEQFNEAMGEFWGDVGRSAAKGAGIGAASGGVAGGLPGALMGLATGGLIGGAYGGGKHLLNKVWQWYKDHQNYHRTKDDALEVLRRLSSHSKKAGISDDRYHQSINNLVDQLSGERKEFETPAPEEKATIDRATAGKEYMPTPEEQVPPQEVAPVKGSKPTNKKPRLPVEPEVEEPEVEYPYPQFKNVVDIAVKIDGGEGKGSEGNFNKLMGGKFKEIEDEKSKYIIYLLGKALYELGKDDPDVWRNLTLEDVNNKIAEIHDKEIPELDKYRFAKYAETFANTILKNRINRSRGGWKKLGLPGFFHGTRKENPLVPTEPTLEPTSEEEPEPTLEPTSEEEPEPEPEPVVNKEEPTTVRSTDDIPGAKPRPKLASVDINDISELERDIYEKMSKDELHERLHQLFPPEINSLAYKLEGTPLEKMLLDGKVGKPGSKERLAIIASLRQAFNKEKINDESDITESLVHKFTRLLKEGRPPVLTYRAKGLPIDERIKLYKESLRGR